MIKPLYSVRDLKAGYGQLFVDVNDETAIRGFRFALNKEETLMYVAASDFELYHVADFDEESGIVIPIEKVFLCSGSDVKEV